MSAVWYCDICRAFLCRLCVNNKDGGAVCGECGGPCRAPTAEELTKCHTRQTSVFRKSAMPAAPAVIARSSAPPPPPAPFPIGATKPMPPQKHSQQRPLNAPLPLAEAKSAAAPQSVVGEAQPQPDAAQAEQKPKGIQPVFLQTEGPYFCKNHPSVKATRRCVPCREYFCDACAKIIEENAHCPLCGTQLKPLTREEQGLPPLPFKEQLKEAFKFPFKGEGMLMLILGTVFMYAASWAGNTGDRIALGYICAYFMKICRTSASGRETPPGWPSFGNIHDDIITPLWYFIAPKLVCLIPAYIYLFLLSPIQPIPYILFGEIEPRYSHYETTPEEEMPETALLSDPQANIDEINRKAEERRRKYEEELANLGPGLPYYALMVAGLVYLPMALLALTLHRNIAVLNPAFIFGSIQKLGNDYVAPFIIVLVAEGAHEVASGIVFITKILGANSIILTVSGSVAGLFVFIYFMMVEMRVLGSLYFTKQKKLDWFNAA